MSTRTPSRKKAKTKKAPSTKTKAKIKKAPLKRKAKTAKKKTTKKEPLKRKTKAKRGRPAKNTTAKKKTTKRSVKSAVKKKVQKTSIRKKKNTKVKATRKVKAASVMLVDTLELTPVPRKPKKISSVKTKLNKTTEVIAPENSLFISQEELAGKQQTLATLLNIDDERESTLPLEAHEEETQLEELVGEESAESTAKTPSEFNKDDEQDEDYGFAWEYDDGLDDPEQADQSLSHSDGDEDAMYVAGNKQESLKFQEENE